LGLNSGMVVIVEIRSVMVDTLVAKTMGFELIIYMNNG